MESKEKTISRAEVKKVLQIKSDVTLWRLTKDRKIPFYRVGRRILFKESEVLAAIHVPTAE